MLIEYKYQNFVNVYQKLKQFLLQYNLLYVVMKQFINKLCNELLLTLVYIN